MLAALLRRAQASASAASLELGTTTVKIVMRVIPRPERPRTFLGRPPAISIASFRSTTKRCPRTAVRKAIEMPRVTRTKHLIWKRCRLRCRCLETSDNSCDALRQLAPHEASSALTERGGGPLTELQRCHAQRRQSCSRLRANALRNSRRRARTKPCQQPEINAEMTTLLCKSWGLV